MVGYAESDLLNRSMAVKQIGMVHHRRFNESLQRKEPANTVQMHAQAAEEHYLKALALCPPTALTDLHPMHHQLAVPYGSVGNTECAREQFEKAVQLSEQVGDRYKAGLARRGMAITYARASKRESAPTRRVDLFHRAQAYAEAALRDFQFYQGRAAADEAETQQLLARITRALGEQA